VVKELLLLIVDALTGNRNATLKTYSRSCPCGEISQGSIGVAAIANDVDKIAITEVEMCYAQAAGVA